MKKRFIVLSSLITILLASFPFTVCADEVAQDSSTIHTLSDGVFLDQYFYDNYDLLPYLESNGNQYIDTSYVPNEDSRVSITLSDVKNSSGIFGTYNAGGQSFCVSATLSQGSTRYVIMNSSYAYPYKFYDNVLLTIDMDKENCYFNNSLVHTFDISQFDVSGSIYIFGWNNSGQVYSRNSFKLYKFSIYDYSLNNDEGGFVRYYYPAKAKTSGTLGLYDAVSKTFITTSGSVPFVNPTDDKVLNFQIGDFVTSGLGWIDDIFDFVIATPIILFFFAVALAGSVYRWARRVVHF